ncbi:DUF2382 domain-containing protein [Kineococcus sp. T13]|uniref:DUF2382 domain-containing protein n=1 Tax=Kineococcus vitellinus TaxID=2696565 RepID=UPI001413015E|nr:PRC and DUF2382 domain-containing protein [Kineococcus vitellinus]NAZ78008.1 DUF2382 domain-containing protein [Kineococcus vitellinus]
MAGNTLTVDALYSATVYDHDGDKIGKVEDVYLDNATSQPEWVSVKTGLFGSGISLIPLERASLSGEHLTVPFEKAKVKDAPHHDPGRELTETDEDDLYRYYGIASSGGSVTGTGVTGRTDTRTDRTDTVGHDTSGPNTDDAMTRSKEELHVGTETREAGRARLRKHIVTERVSRTVPVSHEEIVVEREPITEANRGAALSGGELTEEEHEVTLYEEHAVAAKETVPVERVRLDTQTVQGQETVEAELREEVIDLDTDAGVDPVRRDRR